MAFIHSPKIVTNGLILALDAANTKSYISGSTLWSSLASPTLSATLVNGPTYSIAYGGGITCDGIDDSINMSNSTTTQFPSGSAWSFSITTELLSQNTTYPTILSKGNAGPGGSGILVFYASSGSIYFKHNNDQPTGVSVSMNKPFQYAVTYAGTGSVKIYVNGVYKNNSSTIVYTETSSILNIGSGGNIRTYSFLKYSKELTPQEVLQNFNATKGRFGL